MSKAAKRMAKAVQNSNPSAQQSKDQQPAKQSVDLQIAECIEKLTAASTSHGASIERLTEASISRDKALVDHEKRIALLENACEKISPTFKKKSQDDAATQTQQSSQVHQNISSASEEPAQQTSQNQGINQQNAPIDVAKLTSSRTEFSPGDLDATLNREGVSRGWMYLKRFTDPTGKVIDCWLGPKGTREEAIKFATGEMVKPVVIFRQPNGGFRIENLVNFG